MIFYIIMSVVTAFITIKYQHIYDEALKGDYEERASSAWYISMAILWPITLLITLVCVLWVYLFKIFDYLRGIK